MIFLQADIRSVPDPLDEILRQIEKYDIWHFLVAGFPVYIKGARDTLSVSTCSRHSYGDYRPETRRPWNAAEPRPDRAVAAGCLGFDLCLVRFSIGGSNWPSDEWQRSYQAHCHQWRDRWSVSD